MKPFQELMKDVRDKFGYQKCAEEFSIGKGTLDRYITGKSRPANFLREKFMERATEMLEQHACECNKRDMKAALYAVKKTHGGFARDKDDNKLFFVDSFGYRDLIPGETRECYDNGAVCYLEIMDRKKRKVMHIDVEIDDYDVAQYLKSDYNMREVLTEFLKDPENLSETLLEVVGVQGLRGGTEWEKKFDCVKKEDECTLRCTAGGLVYLGELFAKLHGDERVINLFAKFTEDLDQLNETIDSEEIQKRKNES